jgi:hypothetical protein
MKASRYSQSAFLVPPTRHAAAGVGTACPHALVRPMFRDLPRRSATKADTNCAPHANRSCIPYPASGPRHSGYTSGYIGVYRGISGHRTNYAQPKKVPGDHALKMANSSHQIFRAGLPRCRHTSASESDQVRASQTIEILHATRCDLLSSPIIHESDHPPIPISSHSELRIPYSTSSEFRIPHSRSGLPGEVLSIIRLTRAGTEASRRAHESPIFTPSAAA